MADALELIRAARLPERTVALCMRGDLVAEHEEQQRRLAAAEREAAGSLAGNPKARDIAADITALEALMAEAEVEFRLRALARGAWAALVAAHPPRKSDDGRVNLADSAGYNADTFTAAALRACIVDPVLEDADWGHLVDEVLSDGQYEQFTTAMWELNRSGVSVPFSRAASKIRAASAPE